MKIELFRKVLSSNKRYWRQEKATCATRYLLFDSFIVDKHHCYAITKTILCIAKKKGLRPLMVNGLKNNELASSMCEDILSFKKYFLFIIISHLPLLLYVFLCVSTSSKLLNLVIHKCSIGTCIYDLLLKTQGKVTIQRLAFKERMRVVFEVVFFLFFERVIKKYPIDTVVIADTAYRQGLLYELCAQNCISCISPIDVNSMFLCKYTKKQDFSESYLNKNFIDKYCFDCTFDSDVNSFFKERFAGTILQHDIMNAYQGKKKLNKEEFFKRYKLLSECNTVVIMPHVFCDASHVYPDMIYNDYWDWFVCAFGALSRNERINLLVKEHPSAHLYNEKGIVKSYLEKKGYGHMLIDESESTFSVLNNADIVVTCGGTVGLEFASMGKNVVLACKPYYADLGFTLDFKDKVKYEYFLQNEIQNLRPLSAELQCIARKTVYLRFLKFNNAHVSKLEIGAQRIFKGAFLDDELLYNNILEYNTIPLCEQNIYQYISAFIDSSCRVPVN